MESCSKHKDNSLRREIRPSVQLPGVAGVDSDQAPGSAGTDCTLGLTIVGARAAQRLLRQPYVNNNTYAAGVVISGDF